MWVRKEKVTVVKEKGESGMLMKEDKRCVLWARKMRRGLKSERGALDQRLKMWNFWGGKAF